LQREFLHKRQKKQKGSTVPIKIRVRHVPHRPWTAPLTFRVHSFRMVPEECRLFIEQVEKIQGVKEAKVGQKTLLVWIEPNHSWEQIRDRVLWAFRQNIATEITTL
jgi:hypothetical protein